VNSTDGIETSTQCAEWSLLTVDYSGNLILRHKITLKVSPGEWIYKQELLEHSALRLDESTWS